MPISGANRDRYPADWSEIRARILDRATHRCEWCGVPNHWWRNEFDQWTDSKWVADSWRLNDGYKVAYIVLTIAHVHDPDPANCHPENLAALCQRCHNRHDAPLRQRHAYHTRRAGAALADLFGGCESVER